MDPSNCRTAILYDDDGYVEQLGLPLQWNETRTGLIGRQVAGKEFLDAYLSHGSWTEMVALVRNPASAQSLVRLCQNHPSSRGRCRGLKIIDEHEFHRHFFPPEDPRQPPADLIYNPCPPDVRYAWARHHKGPGAYALSGVTHTMCSQGALEWLGETVSAPFESFDSLICTSQAVVDMVRAVTESYADYLRDRHGGSPQRRIRLEKIPLGVNTGLFRPANLQERNAARHVFQIQEDEVAVLFVGRLSHHGKAHPFPMFHGLSQAARQTGKKVHLMLSGWAPNQAIMKAFEEGAGRFASNIRVSFVDGTEPVKRFAVWRAADLFTSLSDNIQETFGLVIVEAMASGLPVIASDWNGYRDLVSDGETGFLVPILMIRDATTDLVSRLQMEEINYDHFLAECSQAVVVDNSVATQAYARLIGDAGLRRQMGQAGRLRVEQTFSWPRIIQAYESLWKDQDRERREAIKMACGQWRVASKKLDKPGGDLISRAYEDLSTLATAPGRFPSPEHAFACYPTRWLGNSGDGSCFQTVLGGEENLARLLTMPLVNHVAASRASDPTLLRSILAACQFPCPLSEMEAILKSAGISGTAVRATLAWMLKYDLLQVIPASEEIQLPA
jgi:glycosyltransferase involved in cell wall biosynthesis